MASNQIITNKLLAFLQSQLQINNDSSIRQICKNKFTEEEMRNAKTLLYKTLNKNEENSHVKTEKQEKILEEILCLLKETDPDNVPTFVAKECRMPLIERNDVTSHVLRSLKDLENNALHMQKTMSTFQSTIDELMKDTMSLRGIISTYTSTPNVPKRALFSPISTDSAVTDWSVATEFSSDMESHFSRPQSPIRESSSSASTTSDTESVSSAATTISSNVTSNSNFETPRSTQNKGDKLQMTTEQKTALNQRVPKPSTKAPEDDGFVKVERRRKSSESSSKSRQKRYVRPWTTLLVTPMPFTKKAEEVADLIQYKTQLILKVEKVDWRPENQEKVRFSSFAVQAPTEKIRIFMEEGFWPKGAVCRRFSDVLREAKEKRLGIGKDVKKQETTVKQDLKQNKEATITATDSKTITSSNKGKTEFKSTGMKTSSQAAIKPVSANPKISSQETFKSTSTVSSQGIKTISSTRQRAREIF